MQYVELHARSAFSFLEGGSLPEALAITAAGLGLPALALLDKNGFYGSPRLHMAAKRTGIRAHVGTELSVTDQYGTTQYPLLCESREGYQNLSRLISKTKLRVPKHSDSAAQLYELEEHASGVICLTGDERGPLASALQRGSAGAGRALLNKLTGIFGPNNVYVELQRHFQREQEYRNRIAIDLAHELNLPLLATNGVSYATTADREILDVFTCIKNKRQLATAGRLLCKNSERHISPAAQMAQTFADIPEAICNTVELSGRLQFTLEKLGYEFPRYPVPAGETMDSFLYARTWEGAHRRYQPITDRVHSQLERELKLIAHLGLAGYFLIVWDLVRYCNLNGILVQGRGSAANSAVCYSLGITAVDPIGMDLLFERFLSEERGEWPDIDLDLPSGDDREKVIQYVYQRYGQLGAAMTANVITYRGRLAAREVGKVFGFDTETLNRLSTLVGNFEWRGPNDTFDKHFTTAGLDLTQKRIAKYLDLSMRLQDMPRHLGQHSGGMVVCQGQLDSVVPLEPATMPNRVVVQWDKDDCADLGIVKVDLLGLGMMAVLKDSITLIRDHYEEEVDLAHLPQDCPDIYGVIQSADTIGMFQIESRAQMASLPRNNPEKFYDLVTQVALIRPGPITGAMTAPYLKRRQKKELVTYPHPSLKSVLERTLGVPLFQEQLLKMAMICANFTGGEAEELRRALGNKRSKQRMMEIEVRLRNGMTQNGIAPKAQDEIVQFITSFALYGFPESHSASFALLAYASAFLKVRYLAAFTAALLNNQPMGFYAPATLVKDAQRHGLKIKPIDVTCSKWDCSLEKLEGKIGVRIGLRYVRGLQQIAGESLVYARDQRPFSSIENLARRVPELNQRNLRILAEIGALNNISADMKLHRRDALWQIEKARKKAGELLEGIVEQDTASPLAQMDVEERLVSDYHGSSLTTGPHPMFYRREEMRKLSIKSAAELRTMPNGKTAIVAGAVITRQRPGTASGLIFLTTEDETGYANVIVMPHVYEQYRQAVLQPRFIRVYGTVQNQDGIVHLKAERVEPLKVSAAQMTSHDFH
jgi:error-prone DNA polymerase